MTRRLYIVTATREGDWWELDVDGLDGVFTQARRLDQAEAMARDAIAVMLDVPEDSFDIEIRHVLGEPLAKDVEAAKSARAVVDEANKEARQATRRAAGRLRGEGLPVRDIGRILGISHQRAAKILGLDPEEGWSVRQFAQMAEDSYGTLERMGGPAGLRELTRATENARQVLERIGGTPAAALADLQNVRTTLDRMGGADTLRRLVRLTDMPKQFELSEAQRVWLATSWVEQVDMKQEVSQLHDPDTGLPRD